MLPLNLFGQTDAMIWVDRWIENLSANSDIATDEGTMLSWFSNAIEAGREAGRKAEQQRNIVEKLNEIIYQAVGAGTGVILKDNPEYVFPAEQIVEAVDEVLTDFGIPKVEGY